MDIKLTILSLLIGTIVGLSHLGENCRVNWQVSRSWRTLIRRRAFQAEAARATVALDLLLRTEASGFCRAAPTVSKNYLDYPTEPHLPAVSPRVAEHFRGLPTR
jgi:hypothetical protein